MAETTRLGTFIRECRTSLKYTSRQVAKLSSNLRDLPSISNSYLISVENGKHIPRLDKVIALAEVLNVPVGHLVERCREDLGAHPRPAEAEDFAALFESAREQAEASDYTSALGLFRRAYQAMRMAPAGTVDPAQATELRLQTANCYRRLKLNSVAKTELESLLGLSTLDSRSRARATFLLAELHREEGNPFLARILAQEGLSGAREVADEELEGKVLSTLGNIATDEKRYQEALAHFREAAARLKGLGNERAATIARTRQGLALVEMRDYYRAIDLLRTELGQSHDRDPYVRGGLHIALAKAYFGAENYKSARIHARSARECAERLDAPDLMFMAVYYLWSVSRVERDGDQQHWLDRLKATREKLAISFQEVESFDRLVRRPAEKGALQ
jgi:transcriptional regulator with XRE-family HTH domain